MWLVLIVIPQCQHPFLLRSAVHCAFGGEKQPAWRTPAAQGALFSSAARQRRPRARLRAQAGGRPLPAAGTGDSGLGARPPLLPQPRSAPPVRPAGPGSPPAGPDRAGPGPLRRPLPPPPAGPSWAPRGYLLTAEPGRRRRRRAGPRERWEL